MPGKFASLVRLTFLIRSDFLFVELVLLIA
jgi:hypothetical protein